MAPAGEPVPERKLICTALANDIELHLFMASELFALYFQEPKGLINIDINVATGNPHILYHNEQVFRVLGIPYENLYFKRRRLCLTRCQRTRNSGRSFGTSVRWKNN